MTEVRRQPSRRQKTIGLIEEEIYEHRTLNIEHRIRMTLRFVILNLTKYSAKC
ncbi:hypothetical protein D1AOALGA4SA_8069 [Olavius algarvensis Delta 1 endosymbiont]|nr:hypothetical protein D1AOALGA4SA_8069 [Olavius algarvensis Delta 1 endosymbiont]